MPGGLSRCRGGPAGDTVGSRKLPGRGTARPGPGLGSDGDPVEAAAAMKRAFGDALPMPSSNACRLSDTHGAGAVRREASRLRSWSTAYRQCAQTTTCRSHADNADPGSRRST